MSNSKLTANQNNFFETSMDNFEKEVAATVTNANVPAQYSADLYLFTNKVYMFVNISLSIIHCKGLPQCSMKDGSASTAIWLWQIIDIMQCRQSERTFVYDNEDWFISILHHIIGVDI